MNIGLDTLRNDERAIFAQRALFKRYGYTHFRMSRFEEYDLYVQNKDFLVSDRMITFTDLDGTLLALKPDVTISIIKNTADLQNSVRKVYYNENVYRAVKGQGTFREIMQTGLECIGDVDFYHICEVIYLAAKSLEIISEQYVLDISHLGFVSGLMAAAGVPEEMYSRVLEAVRAKNASELTKLCGALGLSRRAEDMLMKLVLTSGDMRCVLDELSSLSREEPLREALNTLEGIYAMVRAKGLERNVRLDFSVVNDMHYYNGVVFQGFVRGIPSSILSGGQYDLLMQKMGKPFGAIGFAVYLDELELLDQGKKPRDVDVLLLYDEKSSPARVLEAVESLSRDGQTVLAERAIPQKLRCGMVVRLEGGEA